jgi:hypothetical protein
LSGVATSGYWDANDSLEARGIGADDWSHAAGRVESATSTVTLDQSSGHISSRIVAA